MHHKVKIVIHDMIGLEQWEETGVWKIDVKEAKRIVQETLAPGRVPDGSREQNVGRKYLFCRFWFPAFAWRSDIFLIVALQNVNIIEMIFAAQYILCLCSNSSAQILQID